MAFKRALWTSGYDYIATCTNCGTKIKYKDNQLDYRAWYPNGFVYCPRCRKPVRHNEIFAIRPDGTKVYATQEEANLAITEGYTGAISGNPVQPSPSTAYCTNCGHPYTKGMSSFCSGCGKKLD